MVPVFYVGLSSVVLTTGAILASGSFQSVICGRWHEWFLLGLGLCGLGKYMGGCAMQLSFVYSEKTSRKKSPVLIGSS